MKSGWQVFDRGIEGQVSSAIGQQIEQVVA